MHSLSADAAVSTTLEPAWKKSVCMCSNSCEGMGIDASGPEWVIKLISTCEYYRWFADGSYYCPTIHIFNTCLRVFVRTSCSRVHTLKARWIRQPCEIYPMLCEYVHSTMPLCKSEDQKRS
jgi:hypothetical protein